jgi:hypothetical protein
MMGEIHFGILLTFKIRLKIDGVRLKYFEIRLKIIG